MDNNFKFENNNNFDLILIKPSNIENISWFDTEYTTKIINLDSYDTITFNSNNFADSIIKNLELNVEGKSVHTQIINESSDYIYELLYIDILKDENEEKFNAIASLLNTNGDKIYGNALFMKTYIPSLSKSIIIENSKLEDIKYVLDTRVKTNIVCYDEEWIDKIVIGNLEDFAKDFFDGEYKKIEIPFLLHNINIWYEIDDFSKNKKYICSKILDKPIYKCLWFTMITDEYRGSIYLKEVEKILKISEHLPFPYNPKPEWIQEENDEFNRKVIKNKYKILDFVYNLLIN
jgi:hypothetical protein